jgi:choline dehydrogenase
VLLEAGKAYPPDGFPAVLTDEARIGGDADHDWGYSARGGRSSPKIVALRGRVLGGSSAINGALAVRARPLDFDRWGMPDWSFDDVLPAYKDLENAPDGADGFHGRSGPFPIRWRGPEGISPSGQAFIDACVHEGFPLITDFNAEVRGGVGATPVSEVISARSARAVAATRPYRAIGAVVVEGAGSSIGSSHHKNAPQTRTPRDRLSCHARRPPRTGRQARWPVAS